MPDDQAIGEFAMAYADQKEKDHAALAAAMNAGPIKAVVEEETWTASLAILPG